MYLVAIVVIDLFVVICYCISDAKSKAVNQSKDRLKTEAEDEVVINHFDDDENEDDNTSAK
nr:MAG TPA: hypothetical protein [Crassvirales sp.]